ncbi:MAG: sulfatase-like hydrolase/transferase [Candidatus Eisenbacteria bacterium]|nr:sulfatase-like hydrolase/transferase [Candidatus Eisenbacteria bacterium]
MRSKRPGPAEPGCPVFLISIDTLRPDHLRCYGYRRLSTPGVDHLAKDGIRFAAATAQAPSTLPSHASMLTSLYPAHHGAFYGRKTRCAPSLTTLAAVLAGGSYRTISYNGGAQIAPEFGLDAGFDRYVVVGEHHFSTTVDSTLSWISRHGADSTFFFLHTYEVHAPYNPRAGYLRKLDGRYRGALPGRINKHLLADINEGRRSITDTDRRHIVAAYDAEILSMDRALATFMDSLRTLGVYDRALIVFTSDHGEEFGEHGMMGWHGHTMYDELLHVPLIVKLPRSAAAGRIVREQVRSIDIAPTILDVAALGIPDSFEGTTLIPLIRGGSSRNGREHARVSMAQKDRGPRGLMKSIRTADWKLALIEEAGQVVRTELFHLRKDPREKENLARDRPEVADSLGAIMLAMHAHRPVPEEHPAVLELETNLRLEALGYVVNE